MIKHIVMWKFKDFAEDNDKRANLSIAKEKLLSLKEKIKALRFIEVGINIEESDLAYDMVLYSEFDNLQALEEYQKHPEHLLVAGFIGKVRESRAVVDYEV